MTEEKHEPDEEDEAEDPKLLPNREVMALIAPGGGGLGGIIPAIGPEADQPLPPAPPPASK